MLLLTHTRGRRRYSLSTSSARMSCSSLSGAPPSQAWTSWWPGGRCL
jgi:hypothetical protein